MDRSTSQAAATLPAQRLSSLDGLRGVAAAIVLVHHSLLVVPALSAGYYDGQVPAALVWFVYSPLHLVWAGGEAVLVFFVLSGFVLARQQTGPRAISWTRYYPSRLVRLYLPVVAAVLFAAFLALVIPRVGLEGRSEWMAQHEIPLTPFSIARNATLLSPDFLDSPLWSLRWEVVFSLLLPLAVIVVLHTQRYWVTATVALVAISSVGVALNSAAFTYLPVFFIGCFCAAAFGQGRLQLTSGVAAATLVTGLIAVTARWWLAPFDGVAEPAVQPLLLLGALAVIVGAVRSPSARRALESAPCQWLGRISFSLYLVHEPVIVSVGVLLPPELSGLGPLISIPLSILVAVTFYRLVEGPSHRIAKRLQTLGGQGHRT
jgi:peptidoglycan/LPS O-acetylase OafA/YrhL